MNKVLRKDQSGHRPAFISVLLEELKSNKLGPTVAAGAVVGLLNVFVTIAFAALIFSADLGPYVANGIGLLLVGAIVTGVLTALFSAIPGSIGGNQSISAAIMVVIVAGLIKEIPEPDQAQTLLPTVVVTMALTGLVFGFSCMLLAYLDLGSLVRFLPDSVVGGFMAGMGWLLVTGSIGLMADITPSMSQIGHLFESQVLVHWFPGLLFALILIILLRHSDSFIVLPAMIAGTLALFLLIAWINGFPIGQLKADGWLLDTIPSKNLIQPWPWDEVRQVDWSAIMGQLPALGALLALSMVSLLLNASGLEATTKHDASINRELKTNGLANLGVALLGGLTGHLHLSFSTINIKIGGANRLSGLISTAICLIVLITGPSLVILVPKLLMGGLLLYLGLSFLKTWVYESWFHLTRLEYATVLIIMVVVGAVGLLEGVATGVIAAVIFFAITYSRIDVIRHELTGRHVKSRMTRSPYISKRLQEEGHRLYVLSLHGYIFFGTAERLVETLHRRLQSQNGSPPEYFLLDMSRVNGLDSTVTSHLHRLKQLINTRQSTIIITDRTSIRRQLQKGGLAPDDRVLYFDDLDRALEWYEDELLQRLGLTDMLQPTGLFERQDVPGLELANLKRLLPFLERLETKSGDYLMVEGDKPDCLYLVESGQVTAQLDFPDRPPLRLESMGSGRVVGEIGFYLGQARTASVVVDKPGVVYRLTASALGEIEREDPQIASALHQLMANLLAQRATHLIQVVDALER